MKKRKLFMILIIIIAAMVFATAQICNQCGMAPAQDTKEDVERETEGDETVEETTAKETSGGTTSTAEPEEPTIELKIYMGPEYHAPDDVCYYRIEAVVTGSPMPDKVDFSKDDSNGSWGLFKAQVNLTRDEPDYTLTATVSNSAGSDSDSIDLSWGCGPLTVEKSKDFHPTDLASVNAAGGVDPGYIFIGDNFFDVDVRGLFAFDISSMADKDVVSAELELKNPALAEVCDFKGDIQIWYVDFLPGGITGSDYLSVPYAGPVSFSWDEEPLAFSSSLLKDTIIDRAPIPRKLQFGITYANPDTGGVPGVNEGRIYEDHEITLTVTYTE